MESIASTIHGNFWVSPLRRSSCRHKTLQERTKAWQTRDQCEAHLSMSVGITGISHRCQCTGATESNLAWMLECLLPLHLPNAAISVTSTWQKCSTARTNLNACCSLNDSRIKYEKNTMLYIVYFYNTMCNMKCLRCVVEAPEKVYLFVFNSVYRIVQYLLRSVTVFAVFWSDGRT